MYYMPTIEEILKLPKEQQLEIMQAIQDNLEDVGWEEEELSQAHIDFINQRVREIESGPQKIFTWNEVKEKLARRWNSL
jgi:putative addiction module component (TIGR02574 family)